MLRDDIHFERKRVRLRSAGTPANAEKGGGYVVNDKRPPHIATNLVLWF